MRQSRNFKFQIEKLFENLKIDFSKPHPCFRRYSPWKGERTVPTWARTCPLCKGTRKTAVFRRGLLTK